MKALFFSALVLIGISSASMANDTIVCGESEQVVQMLQDRFGEVPRWFLPTDVNPKVKLMLFINDQTGTWTILGATSDNPEKVCLINRGQNAYGK